jgi:hypothetical protein
MKNTIRKAAITIGTIAIAALSVPVLADRNADIAYVDEIDSCIAEFATRVDVSEADRVRYVVTKSKRSGIGYALNINTHVYSTSGKDSYAVYCVVRGSSTPVKFTLKEKNS